jgi:hypothetical protein
MLVEEPSAEDYLRWLSEEAFGLPDMFSSMNENFAAAAIEGALAMARDSVDLDIVRVAASESGVDVCLLRPTCGELCGLFRRNGGTLLVTTMCSPLFTPNKRRYLLIFNFCFGSAFLTLLLLSFRSCRKRKR